MGSWLQTSVTSQQLCRLWGRLFNLSLERAVSWSSASVSLAWKPEVGLLHESTAGCLLGRSQHSLWRELQLASVANKGFKDFDGERLEESICEPGFCNAQLFLEVQWHLILEYIERLILILPGLLLTWTAGPTASLLYGNGKKEIQAVNASLFGGFVVVNYVNE